jgi:small subunit ribosomal protein S6
MLDKTEELGQRVLSYAIRHCREGFYYLVQFSVEPRAVLEIKARYRLNPDIVRFMILAAE